MIRIILIALLLKIPFAVLLAVKGDLAPYDFIPDPDFQNWTSQAPIFNSDVPFGGLNDYGTYMVVDKTSDKNVNYLNCDYGTKVLVVDGIVLPSNDPTERFILLEYIIDVNPDRDYELSFKYMNPDIAWPTYFPIISAEIDGIEILEPTRVDNDDANCDPYTLEYSFNSGNRTQITLTVYNNQIFKYPVSQGPSDEIRGNDIALFDFHLFQYCEMTDDDLGSITVCEGESIDLISKQVFDADGLFDITWKFELGGTFNQPDITDYMPTDSEIVYIEIESEIGCVEYDTFNINVFKFPTSMEIGSNLPEARLCPCETTQLEVPDNLPQGNFAYTWGTNDPGIQLQDISSTVLTVDTPAEYYLEISEVNLGCSKTLTFEIEPITGSAELFANNITEQIGSQTVVEISSIVSPEFVGCGFGEIEATLLYDYTVLHNADIEYNIESPGLASYPITIPVNSSITIPFKVLLGLSETSGIEIFDPKLKCNDYDEFFSVQKGLISVSGICKEPGSRLIEPSEEFDLESALITGNTLYANFIIQESTEHYITIYDISGEILGRDQFTGRINELQVIELNLSKYSNQYVFMNIQTLASSSTYMLAVQ